MGSDDMMRCDECVEMMDEFRRGESSPEEAARVERHLAQCPTCAAELEAVRQLGELLKSGVAEVAPSEAYFESTQRNVLGRIQNEQASPGKIVSILRKTPRQTFKFQHWLPAAAMLIVGIGSLVLTLPDWNHTRAPQSVPSGNRVRNEQIAMADKQVMQNTIPSAPEPIPQEKSAEKLKDGVSSFYDGSSVNRPSEIASASPNVGPTSGDYSASAITPGMEKTLGAPGPVRELSTARSNRDSEGRDITPKDSIEAKHTVTASKAYALSDVRAQSTAAAGAAAGNIPAQASSRRLPSAKPGARSEDRLAAAGPAQDLGGLKKERGAIASAPLSPAGTSQFGGALGGAMETESASKLYFDAEDARLAGHFERAVELYERVLKAAGVGELAAKSQLRIGDIEFEHLSNNARARLAYSACLDPKLSAFLDVETLQAVRIRMEDLARMDTSTTKSTNQ